jgi:hypothetical protein
MVVTVSDEVTGVEFGVTGLVEKIHVVEPGRPAAHVSDTGLVKPPPGGWGLMVTVYDAAWPAATVVLVGPALNVKSVTGTVAVAVLLAALLSIVELLRLALLVRGDAADGLNWMLTVAVPPTAIAPTLHATVEGVPVGAAHVPCADAEAVNVAPEAGSVPVNTTPAASSGPLLVMV